MKLKSCLAIAAATLFLAGCETSVETEVRLSDLTQKQNKVIPSNLHVEVASCNDYEDSRKPSSSLVDMQESIPTVFKGAEYIECFRQQMNSFAKFTIPVYLDADGNDKLASDEHLVLTSGERVLLGVTVPDLLKRRMDDVRKKMMGVSLDMSVSITVINDTGNDYPLEAIAIFVDEYPVIYQGITVPNNKQFTLHLSDVSVQAALNGANAQVLLHNTNN